MMKLLKRIAYFFLIIILLTVVAEVTLGIIFHFKDKNASVEPVHDHPYLYYEFNNDSLTNEDGFKTTAFKKKPEGVYRIILTGGSVARGKEPAHTISQYLQDILQARLGTEKIEVINAGVSGYVLQQEFMLTQMKLMDYEPDMIVGLDGYNDAVALALNAGLDNAPFGSPIQWENFQVIKENRWKAKGVSRFAYLFKNVNRLKESWLRKRRFANTDWEALAEEKQIEKVSLQYSNLIGDLNSYCNGNKVRYYQFIQPAHYQRVENRFTDGQGQYIVKLLEGFGQYSSYYQADNAFDLTDALTEQQNLFYDDVHLIPEGHYLIAQLMAEKLAMPVSAHMNTIWARDNEWLETIPTQP